MRKILKGLFNILFFILCFYLIWELWAFLVNHLFGIPSRAAQFLMMIIFVI